MEYHFSSLACFHSCKKCNKIDFEGDCEDQKWVTTWTDVKPTWAILVPTGRINTSSHPWTVGIWYCIRPGGRAETMPPSMTSSWTTSSSAFPRSVRMSSDSSKRWAALFAPGLFPRLAMTIFYHQGEMYFGDKGPERQVLNEWYRGQRGSLYSPAQIWPLYASLKDSVYSGTLAPVDTRVKTFT